MSSLKDFLHFLVGEASVAFYYGMSQVPIFYFGFIVHLKDDAVCQFLLVRS